MKPILVVDDEFDVQQVVADVLRDEGYTVITCDNGLQTLEALASQRPALILLDVMMPRLSGLDVLLAMKKRPELAEVPVVLMSFVKPVVRASDYGWKDFLLKPFNLDALLAVVRKYVGAPEADAPLSKVKTR